MKLRTRLLPLCLLLGACASVHPANRRAAAVSRPANGSRAATGPLTRSQELAEARALRDGRQRPRDRHAALGHYFVAAALPAEAEYSSFEAGGLDRDLVEQAAFEGAKLLAELRPDASAAYV